MPTVPARIPLLHGPTPLHPLPRLTRALGGPRLWVKRDDLSGLGAGGNKARKLEFLLGQAVAESADTVITGGAVQSNTASQLAAAAARLGLRCELVLVDRVRQTSKAYTSSGNVLLNDLLGATVHRRAGSVDLPVELEAIADQVRARGGRPFVISFGGSTPVGALGLVGALDEILSQAKDEGFDPTCVVVPAGSAGTQAGLLAGAVRSGHPLNVRGYSVGAIPDVAELGAKVRTLAQDALAMLGDSNRVPEEAIQVSARAVGEGYGHPSAQGLEAMRLAAQLEGLVLDPVYTGKAMAGLIGDIREGKFRREDEVVFVHTGGLPGVFAYADAFA